MKFLKRVDTVLFQITSVLTGFLMSILTITTLVGVFFRYVLGHPLSWVYEATIVSFSWMIFLGMALAFKKNEHIALEFVVGNLKPKLQYIWKQGINIICLLFMVVSTYHAIKVVQGTWSQLYNTIPIPRGLFYLSFPVAAVPTISHIIVRMVELEVGKLDEHDPRFFKDVL